MQGWEFLKLNAECGKKKEEQLIGGWMRPIYMFESAAQNGKFSPLIMR